MNNYVMSYEVEYSMIEIKIKVSIDNPTIIAYYNPEIFYKGITLNNMYRNNPVTNA